MNESTWTTKVGLARMLAMDRREFMSGQMGQKYVYAQAFVHFLFHGEGGRLRDRFRAFLKAGKNGATVRLFESRVGRIDDLQPRFDTWLDEDYIPMLMRERARQR